MLKMVLFVAPFIEFTNHLIDFKVINMDCVTIDDLITLYIMIIFINSSLRPWERWKIN